MDFIVGIIIGGVVGASLGLFLAGVCLVSRRSDEPFGREGERDDYGV